MPRPWRLDVLQLPEVNSLVVLEHFRAKWLPVRVKKMRQNKNLELGSDSIRTEKALEGAEPLEQDFEAALAAIPEGYGEGVYQGLRYGVTVRTSRDGKRTSLFARALAGGDLVSFNMYRLRSGQGLLRPCEMPAEKIVAFVLGYVPDIPSA